MFYLYDVRVRIHDERSIMQLISSTPLFFDDLIAEPQAPVALDKQQLLDRLRRLKAAGAIGELRRGVAGLKAEIDRPEAACMWPRAIHPASHSCRIISRPSSTRSLRR